MEITVGRLRVVLDVGTKVRIIVQKVEQFVPYDGSRRLELAAQSNSSRSKNCRCARYG